MGKEAKRVLVVDDEEPIRQLMRRFLEPEGYDVLTAENGELALQLCETQRIDLIILDLAMPGLSGVEVLKRVRQRYPSLPVIILTVNQDEVTALETFQLGAIDYVMKPFKGDQLKLAIRAKLL